jgi:hypothetical protein
MENAGIYFFERACQASRRVKITKKWAGSGIIGSQYSLKAAIKSILNFLFSSKRHSQLWFYRYQIFQLGL